MPRSNIRPGRLLTRPLCELNETLIEAAGLPPPEGAPLVHYSAEIDVKIGYPRAC